MTKPTPTNYTSWSDDREKALALHAVGEALCKVEPILRSHGSSAFLNIAPGNTSIRDGFTRQDYEYVRPDEALPVKPKDVIRDCMCAYHSVGIVHNVIDLMSDFAVQGMDVVHQNERIEKFYKEWFRRVHAVERSERFLNLLYRTGNVIVKRHTAKLTARDEERLKRSLAHPDVEVEPPPTVSKREIPWRYVFLNPLSVEVLSEQLVPFLGPEAYVYAVRVPDAVVRAVKSPKPHEVELIKKLPEDIRKRIRAGERVIALDPSRVSVHHYKRDDWSAWSVPMLAPILKDLKMLEKLKLADLAALDGAISCIRVWKLGSLEHKIMPSETVILRLAEMLANNVGGGVMDLIWGPDIELLETSTEVHRFLGEAKYAPILNSIFQGLGIPPTLTGNANPGGFTNNFISLKTLTERLEYGRSLLREFWDNEIRIVQKAMGFRFPARVVFDRLLTDEAAEKQLLLHLADRDLVSIETIQEMFGLTPEIEQVRIRRELRKRNEGLLPKKASPFHDPHHLEGLTKIFAQSGAYAPSEMGVELQPRKSGELTPTDVQTESQKQVAQSKPKGEPGQGRPKNSRDTDKRKQKTVKPRRSASARFVADAAWAEEALSKISKIMSPVYLKTMGKNTLRELTHDEAGVFEEFKFALLCQLPLGVEFGEAELSRAVQGTMPVHPVARKLLQATIARYVESTQREPTMDILRRFQAYAYAIYAGSDSDDGLSPLS